MEISLVPRYRSRDAGLTYLYHGEGDSSVSAAVVHPIASEHGPLTGIAQMVTRFRPSRSAQAPTGTGHRCARWESVNCM